MPNSVGRPRLHKDSKAKQADYRARKDEKDFEQRQLAMRAQEVVNAAILRGICPPETPAWKVLEIVAQRLA
jgi:hypothetical protein